MGYFWKFLMFGQGWFSSKATTLDGSGLVFWFLLGNMDKLLISVSPTLAQTA